MIPALVSVAGDYSSMNGKQMCDTRPPSPSSSKVVFYELPGLFTKQCCC